VKPEQGHLRQPGAWDVTVANVQQGHGGFVVPPTTYNGLSVAGITNGQHRPRGPVKAFI
jgi:hypothetical protein